MLQKVTLGVLLFLMFSSSFAETPKRISYQGRLTDAVGDPLPDTTLDITFSIYRITGDLEWTSGPQPVQITNGLFDYVLGSNVELPLSIMSSTYERFLGIKVGDDPEMTPRTELVSVPYAYKVGTIDGATGGTITGSIVITEDIHSQDQYFEVFYPSNILFESLNEQSADFQIGSRFNFESELGELRLGTPAEGYKFPSADGTTDQVMSTDGDGQLSWTGMSSGSNWTVTNSVLYTNNYWGLARGGADNKLWEGYSYTHVNLGVACTTGTSGEQHTYATISGGYQNQAVSSYASVSGGFDNIASGYYSTVGGGRSNVARGQYATVAGGGGPNAADSNAALGDQSTVGGGKHNSADGLACTVGGGISNDARGLMSTVSGGYGNSTVNDYSTIVGGYWNNTNGTYCFVGGGESNIASGNYSVIAGGDDNYASGYGVVGGGTNNNAGTSASSATVGGGANNTASGRVQHYQRRCF